MVSATTPVLGHPYAGFRSDAADRAYATTWTVLAEGADVVFHTHGDAGAGVLAAIADARSPNRPIWAIGHGTDAHAEYSSTDPELAAVVLTSVVRRYDRALLAVMEQSLEEKPARITVDASDGAFGIPDHGELTGEERALVAVRAGLGAAAFDEAWAQGEALSLEAAVAAAMGTTYE